MGGAISRNPGLGPEHLITILVWMLSSFRGWLCFGGSTSSIIGHGEFRDKIIRLKLKILGKQLKMIYNTYYVPIWYTEIGAQGPQ